MANKIKKNLLCIEYEVLNLFDCRSPLPEEAQERTLRKTRRAESERLRLRMGGKFRLAFGKART
ncbi:MAG: hypothetical protein HWN66_21515 [Candidatus Helarchaeota archaeon]|nr:hypothetical protein [Candidatus Helarchaeota archaeon]